MEKNKELLLADLLIQNQELEKRLSKSDNDRRDAQRKCEERVTGFNRLKKEVEQQSLKIKDYSKQIILKEKLVDIKTVEVNKVARELERVKSQLQQIRSQIDSSSIQHHEEYQHQLTQVDQLTQENKTLLAERSRLREKAEQLEFENRKSKYALKGGKQGTWMYNLESNKFEFSEEWCQLLGYHQNKLERDLDTFLLMIHSDDKQAFKKEFENLLIRQSGTIQANFRLLKKDDSYLAVEHSGAIFRDNKDQLIISGYTTVSSQPNHSNSDKLRKELDLANKKYEDSQYLLDQQKRQISELEKKQASSNQPQLQKQIEQLKEQVNVLSEQLNREKDGTILLSKQLEERDTEVELLKEELESNEKSVDAAVVTEKDTQIKQLKAEIDQAKAEFSNLALVARKTDNAIIITDKEGLIEYVNEGFERLTEFSRQEVIGKKPGTFLQGEETNPDHAKAIRDGLNSKEPFVQDIVNYSKSGRKYWLSISITPIFDEQGELSKFIAVERDVTETKQRDTELEEAEGELRQLMEEQFVNSEQLIEKEKQLSEALAESERIRAEIENLSMVASRTDNAVIITDAHGQIQYVNEGFERITEYTRSEVIGKKPGDFLQGPDTNPEHVKAIRDGLNSKKAFKQEILNYSKTGRPYWLNISINPIFDEEGNVEKFIAIENDITERKEREDEFQNLSLVASRTDNAVIITDRYGMIEWVNEGFERLTEYSLQEVKGKKPGSFLQGPETRREDVRAISQGIKSQKPFKQEIYNYSKSGRGYWLSVSITPTFNENGVLDKFIAIETDITKDKASREQMENLSMVASRTDNAVIITDKYGVVEWVNDGFTRVTEYTLDEVKGKKPGAFLQGEKTRQEDVMAIRRGLSSGKPFRQEIYNYSKSGRGYWLSISMTPIFDETGEIEKFIAIESDITTQKESEIELENLSLVASKTDNAVIITSRDGSIEWVNDGFTKVTEYTLEEVRGKKPGNFLQGPDTREEDVIAIRKGLKSEKPFRSEIYNYSKSGNGYWLSLSITPIFDEYGVVEKLIAIERDITDEKKLREEIEDSEEQLRTIMEDQFANQEQLIEQEQKLKDAIEESEILSLVASKTDNAVIITDKDGLLQYANAGFEKISGYKVDEVMGKKPGTFLQGPDTDPKHVQAIRDGLLSKKPFVQEILNYSKSGMPYWLSISMTPILDEHGEVERFIAIESDISERKAAEEEMQNLSLVASKTDNAVIITNKDGLIEWVNEGFEKITEYKFDEVIGRKPGTFLQGEETKPEQVRAIREGLDTQKPFTAEIYNYSKSGKGYWLALSITPIFDNENNLEKFIAIESDITDRKELELEIQESEEQMRNIMDQQFASSEELMKKEEALNNALEEEKKSKDELDEAMARLKNTQTQMVQNEKMASIGQLTAGIAHEINNPINFVYNGIDSLNMSLEDLSTIMSKYSELEQADPSEVPQLLVDIEGLKKRLRYEKLMKNLPSVLSDIKNGANRTIEIVKGLRVFSRLDEEDQKPANINECLDSTLILLRNKTKDQIAIKKFFDQSLRDIMCFPGQLNQVFMNLLSNAIQAIPEERKDGKIMIYTENLEKSVIIRIMDNGSGIPEDVKKKIFEPFFTTKAVGIGTGLGLSITYGIIEKHDGKIYVNSEVGKGTEFVIELPKESKKIAKTA
ncbi:MAG: PAS domain-containing protein [Bacteroidota bacterium]